jgi:type I restriction enzyme S subunit
MIMTNNNSLELLEKYFDTAIASPDGIQRLRELILSLAMQGKLVPQDPNDPPASELLELIKEKQQQLYKDKKAKKSKELPDIKLEEIPYNIPAHWKWTRMDDLCVGITSGSTPSKDIFSDIEGIPFLKVYNIRNQKIDFQYKSQYIDKEYHFNQGKRSCLIPGDLVMNIVGPPLGKIAIIPDDFPEYNCNQAIVFFRPLEKSLNKYLYIYLLAGTFLKNIELIGTAGQDNISVTKSRSILIPLPPLPEQHRIVAKVEQLMAQCDELEKLRAERDKKRLIVHCAARDRLLNPKDDQSSKEAWDFIRNNFSDLYSVKENVKELRKTILQLAVMGKLVPQDPNDPLASELLKEIEAEKERLIKEKKIKKSEKLLDFTPDEIPFKLQKGWEFIRLDNLVTKIGSGSTPRGGKNAYIDDGIPFLRSQNIWNEGLRLDDVAYISEDTHKKMSATTVQAQDILLNRVC